MCEKVAALRIVRVCLSNLKPHPRNPRTHPEPGSPQWEALKASLEHDYFDPLVTNERNGLLVSGHFRLKVMLASAHYWQGGFSQATVIDDEETQLDKRSKPELIALIQRLRNDRDTTVIREPRGTGNALHPTVKPLSLVARQVWNSSQRGDTVLELFGGSGTTLLAAEQTGRRGVATELDPKFCAVILERLKRQGLSVTKLRDGAAA